MVSFHDQAWVNYIIPFFLLFIHCQVKVNKWIKSTLNSRAKIIGSVISIWSLMFVGVYSICRLVSLSGGQSVIIQLDQDFCTAIFILLGNFAVLLSNFKFQTIIWPWKSLKPKTEKKKMIAFFNLDSKTVFKCKARQNLLPVISFKTAWWIFIYEYGF